MRRIRVGFLAVVAVWACWSPALAGFIATRAQWNALDQSERLSYVSGVFDGLTTYWLDEPYSEARSNGWRACMRANSMTNRDLMDMVDLGYQDVGKWGDAPMVVLMVQLNRVCYPYENAERARLGIEAIQPPLRD